MAVTSPTSHASASVARRAARLEAAFERIAAERMAGIPLLNPSLRVQAVGFRWHTEAEDASDERSAPSIEKVAVHSPGVSGPVWALGVLVTPWFMNLVRLPMGTAALPAAPGSSAWRSIAGRQLEFFGSVEDGPGGFEACSLFSPMADFADQAAAVTVATEVLGLLRPAAAMQASAKASAVSPMHMAPARDAAERSGLAGNAVQAPPNGAAAARDICCTPEASRRGFLFGRSAAGLVR